MPRISTVAPKIVAGATFQRGYSKRRIVNVVPNEKVTYEQLTSVRGPGAAGDTITITWRAFYNWMLKAKPAAPVTA
jgi:hypothetical protein